MSGDTRASWFSFQRLVTLLLSLTCVFLLPACQRLNNARLILPPSWSGMEAVADDVWAEKQASAEQRARYLSFRETGRSQAALVLGALQTSPTHVFCETAACFDRLGGGRPRAKTFGSFRALYSPNGLSAHYVAHESWHAEFNSRAGWSASRKVPAWFDEGVAVWLSEDPDYAEAVYQGLRARGIEPPALTELETSEGFNRAMDRFGDYNWAAKAAGAPSVVYTTAAHEIRRWIGVVGPAGLIALMDGLARGTPFNELYQSLEQGKRAS
jgi:hypothetical protein